MVSACEHGTGWLGCHQGSLLPLDGSAQPKASKVHGNAVSSTFDMVQGWSTAQPEQ